MVISDISNLVLRLLSNIGWKKNKQANKKNFTAFYIYIHIYEKCVLLLLFFFNLLSVYCHWHYFSDFPIYIISEVLKKIPGQRLETYLHCVREGKKNKKYH